MSSSSDGTAAARPRTTASSFGCPPPRHYVLHRAVHGRGRLADAPDALKRDSTVSIMKTRTSRGGSPARHRCGRGPTPSAAGPRRRTTTPSRSSGSTCGCLDNYSECSGSLHSRLRAIAGLLRFASSSATDSCDSHIIRLCCQGLQGGQEKAHPIWKTSSAWCSSTCSRFVRLRRSCSATCAAHCSNW